MKIFGKNGKKMGEDVIEKNSLPNNLDGQKWENHFKNLFKKIGGDIDNISPISDLPTYRISNEKFSME